MLLLTLTPGEYFTIGGRIVVQARRLEGGRVHVAVEAPREMPIVRGSVWERQGGERPACLPAAPEERRRAKWVLWDQGKEDCVRAMRSIADRLDTPDGAALRAQLERLTRQEAGEER